MRSLLRCMAPESEQDDQLDHEAQEDGGGGPGGLELKPEDLNSRLVGAVNALDVAQIRQLIAARADVNCTTTDPSDEAEQVPAKAEECTVVVVKEENEQLGMGVSLHNSVAGVYQSLVVKELKAGAIQRWNADQFVESEQVSPGDVIVSVNGTGGDAETMMRELAAPEVHMVVRKAQAVRRRSRARSFAFATQFSAIPSGAMVGFAENSISPLMAAVCKECRGEDLATLSDIVALLLENRADPEQEDEVGGDWALLQASQWNQAELVGLMLEARADPNRATARHDARTPVAMAAESGSAEALSLLLQARGDVLKATGCGESVAFLAAAANKPKTLQQILQARASPDSADPDLSPLVAAVEANGQEALEVLLSAIDSEVNMVPVVRAAAQQSAPMLRSVLQARGDPDPQDGGELSLLDEAVESAGVDVLRVLLEFRADPTYSSGSAAWPPLCRAAAWDHTSALGLLLEAKADLEAVGPEGSSAVLVAIKKNSVDSLKVLLEAKADPTKASEEGGSPLAAAIAQSHLGALRLLLQAGAPPDSPSVFAAMGQENLEALALLLKARGDANAIHENGAEACSAVFAATREHNCEALKMLLSTKGDANRLQPNGLSPVLAAASRNNSAALALLLQARGDVNSGRVVGEHSITFEPGPIHLRANFNIGKVTAVPMGGQGAQLGVQLGWTILSLDGAPYSEQLLDSKIAGSAPYTVVFGEDDGATPTVAAAENGAAAALEVLLQARADVTAPAPGGASPVAVAAERGHADVLCLLLNARGDPTLARAKSGSLAAGHATPTAGSAVG